MAAKSKLRTESEFEGYRRQRVSDLRRLFRDRYGLQFPDDDAGLIDLKELLCPISLGLHGERQMKMAIELLAPWIVESGALKALIAEIMALPRKERMPTAEVLGKRQQLANDDRERIGIRTLKPCDRTKAQLEEQRKAKARGKAQRLRLKRGGRTREVYLAELPRAAWRASGMSKSSYYKRKAKDEAMKAASETGSVPTAQTANGTGSVPRAETVETGSVPDKSFGMGYGPSLTLPRRKPSITDSMIPVSTLTLRSDDGLRVFHVEFI